MHSLHNNACSELTSSQEQAPDHPAVAHWRFEHAQSIVGQDCKARRSRAKHSTASRAGSLQRDEGTALILVLGPEGHDTRY